jgi:D-arabinose 1-dehydrogenase-like Zn-dependent alcohol dehydrogenase
MKAAIVVKKGAPLVIEDRPIPEPSSGEVRIKVQACRVCHSDQFIVDAMWPGLILPRVPGHEVAGVVDAVGSTLHASTLARGSGLAGTEATVGSARPAAKGTLSCVDIHASPASRTMAAMRST